MRTKMFHLTLLWLICVCILGTSSTNVTREVLGDVIQLNVNKKLRDIIPNANYSTSVKAENDITKCISDLFVSTEEKTLLDQYPNKMGSILKKICPGASTIENCLYTNPRWDMTESNRENAECSYRCFLENPFLVEKCFHNYTTTDESSVQNGAIQTYRKMFYALCSTTSTRLSDLDDSSTSDCILKNLWQIDGCFSNIYSSRTNSSHSTCSFVDEVMSCLNIVVETCEDTKLMALLKLVKDNTLEGSKCLRAGIEDLSFKPPREGLVNKEKHEAYNSSLFFNHVFFSDSAVDYLAKCKGLTRDEFVLTKTFQDLYSFKRTLDKIVRISFRCCFKNTYSISDVIHTIIRHWPEILQKHDHLFKRIEGCFDDHRYHAIKKVVVSTQETLADIRHTKFLLQDLNKFLNPHCLMNSVRDTSVCFDEYLLIGALKKPKAERTHLRLHVLLECLENILVKCALVENLKREASYKEFMKSLVKNLIHYEYIDRNYFSRDKMDQMMKLMDVRCSPVKKQCTIADKIIHKVSNDLPTESISEDSDEPLKILEDEQFKQLYGNSFQSLSPAVEEKESKMNYSNALANTLMDSILLDIHNAGALSGKDGNMDFIALLEYECQSDREVFDDFLGKISMYSSVPKKTVLDSWVRLGQSFMKASCDTTFLGVIKSYKNGMNSCISTKWFGLAMCARLATLNHLEQQKERFKKLGSTGYFTRNVFFQNFNCPFPTQLLDCAADVLSYCTDIPPISNFNQLKNRVLREMDCSRSSCYSVI